MAFKEPQCNYKRRVFCGPAWRHDDVTFFMGHPFCTNSCHEFFLPFGETKRVARFCDNDEWSKHPARRRICTCGNRIDVTTDTVVRCYCNSLQWCSTLWKTNWTDETALDMSFELISCSTEITVFYSASSKNRHGIYLSNESSMMCEILFIP